MTEQLNYAEQKKSQLTKRNRWAFEILENIDGDYVTFILGFVSSIVINDFCEIFNLNIKECVEKFYFMLAECVGLTIVTVVLLNFTIGYSKMQKELLPHKTLEARRNYFQEKMVGVKTKKFWKRLIIITALSAIVFLMNLFKLIWFNCN